MKRYYAMLFLFVVCLLIAGCRRSSGTPRRALDPEVEQDILTGLREKELMWAIRPLDRRVQIWIEDPIKVEMELKKEPESTRKSKLDKLANSQDALEKVKGGEKVVSGLKSARNKEETVADLTDFGKVAFKYLKKVPPKEYAVDEFYKEVRRNEYFVQHKYLDKIALEIVSEDVYMTKLRMTLVTAVDMKRGGHIIAFAGGSGAGGAAAGGGMMGGMMAGGGGMMGGPPGGGDEEEQPTQAIMRTDEKITYIKPSDFNLALRVQELDVVWLNYAGFAAPHYLKTPANPVENNLLVAVLRYPTYDAMVKAFQNVNMPETVLRDVAQRAPTLLKNPIEPRDLELFKKYLQANAPPSVARSVTGRSIAINMNADWRASAPALSIAACFTAVDSKEVKQQKQTFGHLAIYTNGATGYVQTPAVKAFLPPPPEENKGPVGGPPMGGGMPGGGKGGGGMPGMK